MKIHFILVNPATPGNVGSSVRALKTMGFNSLRLVNPCDYLSGDARKMAYGSHDLLESSVVFETLSDATNDIDLSIATTSKKRTIWNDYFTPEACKDLVKKKGKTISSLAIVFGREENGLLEEEMELCDIRSIIPMADSYPSLNLAQSVMIYAYIFSEFQIVGNDAVENTANPKEQKILKERSVELLERIEVSRNPNLYRRMMERLMLANEDDTHLFLSFHRYLMQKLNKLD